MIYVISYIFGNKILTIDTFILTKSKRFWNFCTVLDYVNSIYITFVPKFFNKQF